MRRGWERTEGRGRGVERGVREAGVEGGDAGETLSVGEVGTYA